MTRPRVGGPLVAAAAVLLVAFGCSAGVALGQQAPVGYPTITLDRSVVHPGDHVVVQFHNWNAHFVTLSVCGNLARRGSADCDLVNSQGVPITRYSLETLTDFVVTAPPSTCPCVVRASNSDQTEIAYAPITLVGVPTGPVVSPSDFSPLEVNLAVKRVHGGLGAALRSSLGGPTAYDISLFVRNKSAEALTDVRPYGWAGRSKTDQARTLDFPPVGELGPGQSWSHTVRRSTPAPQLGMFYWEVTVSGAGPSVHRESVTRDTPWLLLIVVAVIIGDLAAIVLRRLKARHEQGRPQSVEGADADGAESPGPADDRAREAELSSYPRA
jgi:sortase A